MTAIGFVLTLFAIFIRISEDLDSYGHQKPIAHKVCNFLFGAGFVLFLSGITIKIWEVMP